MKTFTCFMCFFLLSFIRPMAQTYLPLADNMIVSSNSNVKILGGNYSITDNGGDGLIEISNAQNIIIDGDSVNVDGGNYSGYLFRIDNSSNVTIINFNSAKHFYYAVYCTNSHNITISNCNFSFNKVDSSGWIDVWSDYASALGGGAMFYNCDTISVHDDTMRLQNDGVALYHCAHAAVYNCDFEWNTSYGIRMFFTDSCSIHDNLSNHINRPLTDPSDCGAILLIVSNENDVEHNDFSYSGDGIFLGQYQYSNIPNNNYFAYNECSGSPHNAIEATFADGNIYRHNKCNMSEYGFWLGYSFNSSVDSNEVNYNQYSGIAIDRGFNNKITHNSFVVNPNGIELWEGSVISGYENQTSHDYTIDSNTFDGNTIAISAIATENMTIDSNSFIKNYSGIEFSNSSTNEIIAQNYFDPGATYDIQNTSSDDIAANDNTFRFCDSSFIQKKILDENDNAGYGQVSIDPYNCNVTPSYQTEIPEELSEPPSVWYSYPEECWWLGIVKPITVTFDSSFKHDGVASVHLSTGTGWYNGLHYFPEGDSISSWNLAGYTHLSFWIYSIDTNLGAFQYFHVRIGNSSGGYFKYNSTGSALNQSLNTWKNYSVPLGGGNGWTKQTFGTVSLSDINYVEVYTDSYGVGYDLWLDGVQFTGFTGVQSAEPDSRNASIFPNPFSDQTAISFTTSRPEKITITISDVNGKVVKQIENFLTSAGDHVIILNRNQLASGMYFYEMRSAEKSMSGKMIVE